VDAVDLAFAGIEEPGPPRASSHPRWSASSIPANGEIDGVHVIYAVMERSEGNLANVLPERALTVEETREMLEAAVDALAWLHERGLVHGALAPANIVAVGDRIKLAERLHHAGRPRRAAEDVRALGATIVHALIQDPEAAIPENLPSRFSILRGTVSAATPNPDGRSPISAPILERPPAGALAPAITGATLHDISRRAYLHRRPAADGALAGS